MKKINIFLDDIREPKDAYSYTHNTRYLTDQWVVVRSYNEFVNYIDTLDDNTIIEKISWDHDLAAEHYELPNQFDSYEDYLKYVHKNPVEPSGYDAMIYLFYNSKIKYPKEIVHYVHSQNPMGATHMKLFIQTQLQKK